MIGMTESKQCAGFMQVSFSCIWHCKLSVFVRRVILHAVTDAEFIASWFFSIARRWNGRIASYVTISATQSIGKNRPIENRSRDRVKYFPLLLMVFYISGCAVNHNYAPVRPYYRDLINGDKYYVVKKGDTLYAIGYRSGHGYKRLSQWNNIKRPYELRIGQKIKLFKPKQKLRRAAKAKKRIVKKIKKRNVSQKTSTISTNNKKMLKLYWQWPLRGKVLKTFLKTGKKGMDISGKIGEKVKSAASGKVVYSGSGLKGYGNLLIIKHNYLYLSAYANNRRLLVKEGQLVKKGQVIAEVGSMKGKPTALHFEIRRNGKPVNPLKYLPK